MRAWPVVLLCLLLLLPVAYAVQYSNVTLSSGSSQTNVSFSTVSVDCDSAAFGDTYLTLSGCTVNNSIGAVTSAVMNFTSANNLTESVSFPAFSASPSSNTRTITNGLNFSVNVSINASTVGIVPRSLLVTLANGSSENPSYSFDNITGRLVINTLRIAPGVNYLMLDSGYPNITVTGPENRTSDTDGVLDFTYRVSGNIANCSLQYANGTVIQTTSSVSNSSANSFGITGVFKDHPQALNPLNWRLACTSVAGNTVNSSDYQLVTYTGVIASASSSSGDSDDETDDEPAIVRNYEISIESIDATVRPGDSLRAKVVIKTIGSAVPKQLGILEYTIVTPEGNKLPAAKLELLEGEYSRTIEYPVPADAALGSYRLEVTWNAKQLEPVTDSDSFEVTTQTGIPMSYWIVGGVVIGVIGLFIIVFLAASAILGSGGRGGGRAFG